MTKRKVPAPKTKLAGFTAYAKPKRTWKQKNAPPPPMFARCLVEDCDGVRKLPSAQCLDCIARAERASKLVAATGVKLSRVEAQGRGV